jgi:chromosome segregation ATPase
MRKFGKFLVFTTLVLSLIFLTWAIALYTQRLDWAPHKNIITGEVDMQSGRLYQLTLELKTLGEDLELAEKRWQRDAATLLELDNRREVYQKWYKEQLALAQTGTKASGEKVPDGYPPVIQLIRDENSDPPGMYIMDEKQRKAVTSGEKPVQSIAHYNQEYQRLKKQVDDLQVEIDRLIDENKKLTELIAGIAGKSRGLRGDVDDLNNHRKQFEDEIAILMPLLRAQQINIEQEKRRLEQLEERFKVLQDRLGLPNPLGS